MMVDPWTPEDVWRKKFCIALWVCKKQHLSFIEDLVLCVCCWYTQITRHANQAPGAGEAWSLVTIPPTGLLMQKALQHTIVHPKRFQWGCSTVVAWCRLAAFCYAIVCICICIRRPLVSPTSRRCLDRLSEWVRWFKEVLWSWQCMGALACNDKVLAGWNFILRTH